MKPTLATMRIVGMTTLAVGCAANGQRTSADAAALAQNTPGYESL